MDIEKVESVQQVDVPVAVDNQGNVENTEMYLEKKAAQNIILIINGIKM